MSFLLRTPYAVASLFEPRASDALSTPAAQDAPPGSTLESEFGEVLATRGRVKLDGTWWDTWYRAPAWPNGETFVPKEIA